MTAPIDEARLRELAPWTQANTDLLRVIATDVNIAEWFANPTMPEFLLSACNALDALSAERERVADMQRRLDRWEPKPTSGSSIAVSSRIGGNNAPLATQKAEGAE